MRLALVFWQRSGDLIPDRERVHPFLRRVGIREDRGTQGRLIQPRLPGQLPKLKQYRASATRYDKTKRNFLAAIHLAATVIWLMAGHRHAAVYFRWRHGKALRAWGDLR